MGGLMWETTTTAGTLTVSPQYGATLQILKDGTSALYPTVQRLSR